MLPGLCKAAAVHKICMFHSKAGCPLIHLPYKFFFTSRQMLCHGHTGIVSGGNDNAFDHGFYGLRFSFFQKYLSKGLTVGSVKG